MTAQLRYDGEVPTINYYIKKIFDDAELSQGATIPRETGSLSLSITICK
ncbi:hypothetical protein ACYULU_02090 [Breznakiellaceae bacterium SP9]